MMTDSQPHSGNKSAKKAAKAEVKAAKKLAKLKQKAGPPDRLAADSTPAATREGNSPAERSARAAEEKVRLERKRVIIGAVAAGIALISGVVTILRGC